MKTRREMYDDAPLLDVDESRKLLQELVDLNPGLWFDYDAGPGRRWRIISDIDDGDTIIARITDETAQALKMAGVVGPNVYGGTKRRKIYPRTTS